MLLLREGQLAAAENMRRDERLLALARPVVRLYGWSPEAVSLGSGQNESALDLAAVRELGLDVVQRGTGGGGILHSATEVTYAVVVPIDHAGMPRDLPGSFAYLGQGVLLALRALGAPAEVESVPDLTRDALCYIRKQGTNIVAGGKKLSGGAQRRTKWAVLQHGTVIVERDEARLSRVFRTDEETVRARVTSLRVLGLTPTREEIVEALAAGFAQALGPLTPATWAEADPG
jgi:lipoate-protein ligase A